MVGMNIDGLRAKIVDNRMTLTQSEAVDMFLLFPTLTNIKWKNGNAESVKVDGLNLEFPVGA